jgi:hypothetical protein
MPSWGSCGRQQSATSKAKGEVDNDHQRNRAGNTGKRSAEGDSNRCKRARRKSDIADDDPGLRHRLSLDFEGNIHAPSNSNGGEEREELEEGVAKVPA